MPVRPSLERTVTKSESSNGDEIEVSVAISVRMCAQYQSVEIQAGTKQKCPRADRDNTYKKCWDAVNDELSNQMADARLVLKGLIKTKRNLEGD